MSRYQVDKLLRDLRRDRELAATFRTDRALVLDHYQLDPTERELLTGWNVRALYDRGVNPLLLMLAHAPTGHKMFDYGPAMRGEAAPPPADAAGTRAKGA